MSGSSENVVAKDFSNPEWKREYNVNHFRIAAPKYDIATRALSFFRDGAWKRRLIDDLPALERPRILDLACGTGDITFALAERYPGAEVVGLDITPEMIEVAKKDPRAAKKGVSFQVGDIDSLPFEEEFDLVTGGYALRNAPSLERAIAEISRVMKSGAVASFLDFTKPESAVECSIRCLVLQSWGSLWGVLLHADPSLHGYIAQSLKTYRTQKQIFTLCSSLGLQERTRYKFMFGSVEVFSFKKAAPVGGAS